MTVDMSNQYNNLHGSDNIMNAFGSAPSAVTMDELKYMFNGLFTCETRIKDSDGNPLMSMPDEAKHELEIIFDKWEKGTLPPVTQDQVDAMKEQNEQAFDAFLETQHSDNIHTEEMIQELRSQVDAQNTFLEEASAEYRERLDKEKIDEEDNTKLKRKRPDEFDLSVLQEPAPIMLQRGESKGDKETIWTQEMEEC